MIVYAILTILGFFFLLFLAYKTDLRVKEISRSYKVLHDKVKSGEKITNDNFTVLVKRVTKIENEFKTQKNSIQTPQKIISSIARLGGERGR